MKRHFHPTPNQGDIKGMQGLGLGPDERRAGIPYDIAQDIAKALEYPGLNVFRAGPGDFDYNRPVDQMPVAPLGSAVTINLL